MVVAGAGNHVKFARLTDSERCAHFLGVLSIAAQSPIRGCLLVGDQEADAVEIAHEAGVSVKVAKSALVKLKDRGILERDDELGCWRVHDWDDVNPAPKVDATSAERQARYRQRLRDRGLTRHIPSAVKDAVMERDEARCVSCGSDRDVEFHHLIEVVDGGRHELANIELRCERCHRGHAGHGPVTAASRRNTCNENGHVTGDPSRAPDRVRPVPEGIEEEAEVPPNPQGGLSDPDPSKPSKPKAPTPEEKAAPLGFVEWLEDLHAVTGKTVPGEGTKTRAKLASRYLDCCAELDEADRTAPLPAMKLATRAAHADPHRAEHGYDGPENVLRVTKILGLVNNGRRLSRPAQNGSVDDLQAALDGARGRAA